MLKNMQEVLEYGLKGSRAVFPMTFLLLLSS